MNTASKINQLHFDVERPLIEQQLRVESLVNNLEQSGMNRMALKAMCEWYDLEAQITEVQVRIDQLLDTLESEYIG